MPLDDIRIKIDSIDTQLLDLLAQRAECVHVVGEIKKKEGLQIYAPEREELLLRKLIEKSDGNLPEKSIRAIYREIMSMALALEDDLKIAYLGPEGTWTHQAAIRQGCHHSAEVFAVRFSHQSCKQLHQNYKGTPAGSACRR